MRVRTMVRPAKTMTRAQPDASRRTFADIQLRGGLRPGLSAPPGLGSAPPASADPSSKHQPAAGMYRYRSATAVRERLKIAAADATSVPLAVHRSRKRHAFLFSPGTFQASRIPPAARSSEAIEIPIPPGIANL